MARKTKDHFLGVRVDATLIEWMKEHADAHDMNLSEVIRTACIEFKGRIDALQTAKEKHDLEVLREHLGEMYTFEQTESGLLLKRIEPKTIVLGTERREKSGQQREAAERKCS